MDDLSISILYEQRCWWSEHTGSIVIIFNENNTGELVAQGELGQGAVFGVNTRWRFLDDRKPAPTSDEVVKLIAAGKSDALCHSKLEITLENSMTEGFKRAGANAIVNQTLAPAAFMPRTFNITIQAGNFMYERDVGTPHDYMRYGLRLTFDPSPYPTADGYAWEHNDFPDLNEWCPILLNTKVFYAKSLPKSSRKVRATNDHTSSSQAQGS